MLINSHDPLAVPQMSTRFHGQPHDRQLPRPDGCLPNVNLQPNVNLRSCQTHLGQLRDRHLPRPIGCPPGVNVNPQPGQTHFDQPRDRQLPRPMACLPNVNLPPRPTNSLPHLGQPHDRHLPKPIGCPPVSMSTQDQVRLISITSVIVNFHGHGSVHLMST